ncbi:MAG: Putative zinc protease [uncultured Campylobacterales bacterium]|uniref:Zinc protease n=1 Tax=uncultured Campylobacterales bacterium TaxID=352960 RepID=A0A6S6S4D0_9BACT|nr:MAG: Putative zinc protease [uncultured Campylobacterales bacterium]
MKIIFVFISIMGVLMSSVLPKYYEQTQENGLKVIAIPMNEGSNVITTDVFYQVGSGDEIMGKSGIAHMLEHLNFKSTKNLKAGEFDKIVKGFGGVNNASTGFDYTHYYIKSSSSNMDKSLELFAELMSNLNLKDDEFQSERDVVAEERRWRTDNSPIGYLYFKLFNLAYEYHSYHWTPIGFMGDIQTWTIEDIREFHKKFYQPSNAIVMVAGDINKDEVFKSTQKYFGKINNSVEIKRNHTKEIPQNEEKRSVIYKSSEVEMVAVAYKIPEFNHKDQIALSMLGELLSSGKSSILNRVLIDEKKLLSKIYAYPMDTKSAGVFMLLGVCNTGVEAKDAEIEILKILDSIKSAKFDEKELEKIKINVKLDFIHSIQSSSGVVNLYGEYFAKGDVSVILDYEDDIKKITKKDIVDVAKKYLKANKSTTIILKNDLSK